jgi:hypothetical protein
MAGWSSEVDICNGALALLGSDAITSLADDDQRAILCTRFYEQTRDLTLAAYPWNFATKRADLGASLASTDANYPVWGFTYAFALPAGELYCLRVLETEDGVPHRVEGRTLYCNSSTVRIRYIRRVTDAAIFTPHFSETLAAALAMRLAMPITKSKSYMDSMAALYTAFLTDAYDIDTQEGTADDIESDALIDVRYRGAYR